MFFFICRHSHCSSEEAGKQRWCLPENVLAEKTERIRADSLLLRVRVITSSWSYCGLNSSLSGRGRTNFALTPIQCSSNRSGVFLVLLPTYYNWWWHFVSFVSNITWQEEKLKLDLFLPNVSPDMTVTPQLICGLFDTFSPDWNVVLEVLARLYCVLIPSTLKTESSGRSGLWLNTCKSIDILLWT